MSETGVGLSMQVQALVHMTCMPAYSQKVISDRHLHLCTEPHWYTDHVTDAIRQGMLCVSVTGLAGKTTQQYARKSAAIKKAIIRSLKTLRGGPD